MYYLSGLLAEVSLEYWPACTHLPVNEMVQFSSAFHFYGKIGCFDGKSNGMVLSTLQTAYFIKESVRCWCDEENWYSDSVFRKFRSNEKKKNTSEGMPFLPQISSLLFDFPPERPVLLTNRRFSQVVPVRKSNGTLQVFDTEPRIPS